MSQVSTYGLRYVLCPGSHPETNFLKEYEEIYDCWASVWRATFEEVDKTHRLFADVFTHQDHLGAIFQGEHCIAMAGFRWHWADRCGFAEDEYFSQWSEEARVKLCSRGARLLVCGGFAVRPQMRRDQMPLSLKDLLMGMVVQTYQQSRADAMAGAVRVDRGMTGAGIRWGAQVLASSVDWSFSKGNTDLIGFFRDHLATIETPALMPVVKRLWDESLHIRRDETLLEFARPSVHLSVA